jgi:hypothetical protein
MFLSILITNLIKIFVHNSHEIINKSFDIHFSNRVLTMHVIGKISRKFIAVKMLINQPFGKMISIFGFTQIMIETDIIWQTIFMAEFLRNLSISCDNPIWIIIRRKSFVIKKQLPRNILNNRQNHF